jgi:tartrate-resistant acid phosphatase type 5
MASRGRDFTLTPQQQAQQLAWLEQELERPRATPFLVVMGQSPSIPMACMGTTRFWFGIGIPSFRSTRSTCIWPVTTTTCSTWSLRGNPASFVISGGGGALLTNPKIDPSERGPYGQKVYGFSHLSVTPRQMTLRHLDSDGRMLHAFTKTSEGKIKFTGPK